MGDLSEYLDINVDGNRINLNDQGGVVTMFGNAKEIYQLEPAQEAVLRDMVLGTGAFKHDQIRELLESIPSPKLVDMAAMMADEKSDFDYNKFKEIRDRFADEPRYIGDYRLMYEIGIKKSDGQFAEPSKDIEGFEEDLDKIKAKMESKGWDHVKQGEAQITDVVQPATVQEVDFTKIR